MWLYTTHRKQHNQSLDSPSTRPDKPHPLHIVATLISYRNHHPTRNQTGVPLRLPIHDVARSKAGALGVGGKLEGGAIRVGSKVALLPGGEVGVVKSIEVNGQVGRLVVTAGAAGMAMRRHRLSV